MKRAGRIYIGLVFFVLLSLIFFSIFLLSSSKSVSYISPESKRLIDKAVYNRILNANSILELYPTEDSFVNIKNPSRNYGDTNSLEVDGSPEEIALIKFSLNNIDLSNLKSVKLRLYVTNTGYISSVKLADNLWNEDSVTFNNMPEVLNNELLIKKQKFSRGKWAEIEVNLWNLNSDTLTFFISSDNYNGIDFYSREKTDKMPVLVLTFGSNVECEETIRGDINNDGVVDILDYCEFSNQFNKIFYCSECNIPGCTDNGDNLCPRCSNNQKDCDETGVDCGGSCPSCEGICGNNILENSEECDDGNIINGDGCSRTCKRESVSVCTDRDGDGYSIEDINCGLKDCNDNDKNVNPGVSEICDDNKDNNCNLLVDENCNKNQQLLAFPEAEGYGANSKGGRGGKVIGVTNLNDNGVGSLRACIDDNGPRTCVFRVGGIIDLDSSLVIKNPYITIAGQTAPGSGIMLRNRNNLKASLKVETHDVIIRYIRARPGPNKDDRGTLDAITISSKTPGAVHDVIVDHSSFSWATDENSNFYYDSKKITLQWSIISEGLDCSTHAINVADETCHSKGLLTGSEDSGYFTIHHNLFAHNRARNPRIKTSYHTDVINNVMYNTGGGSGWQSPTYILERDRPVTSNYIGNYFKPGPDTGNPSHFIETKDNVNVYVDGNYVPSGVKELNINSPAKQSPTKFDSVPINIQSASDAYASVLNMVGASQSLTCDGRWISNRDSVDSRIINEVNTGTGKIIDCVTATDNVGISKYPSDCIKNAGGWPTMSNGVACVDSDHDGMPDEFEKNNGLNPNDPSDGNLDSNNDGYTNLEEYLN